MRNSRSQRPAISVFSDVVKTIFWSVVTIQGVLFKYILKFVRILHNLLRFAICCDIIYHNKSVDLHNYGD